MIGCIILLHHNNETIMAQYGRFDLTVTPPTTGTGRQALDSHCSGGFARHIGGVDRAGLQTGSDVGQRSRQERRHTQDQ